LRDKTRAESSGIGLLIIFVVAVVVILFVGGSFIAIVPAGHVGVKDTFGQVDADVFQPGLHFKNPFTGVIMFSTQTQKYYDPGTRGDTDVASIEALSNEGLTITMEIAVLYHVNGDAAPNLYKTVGENYQDVVMKQPIHTVPRDIISRYDFKTLYSAGASPNDPNRAKIEYELWQGISNALLINGQSRGIDVESVYIRKVDPPQSLKDSITAKLNMEQQIQQKAFEVQVAQKEAERKIVEAQGIAGANKIIGNSLTPAYIEWYTIDMMRAHSGAVFFIPVGTDGRVHPETYLPITSSDLTANNNYNAPSTSDLSTGLYNITMPT